MSTEIIKSSLGILISELYWGSVSGCFTSGIVHANGGGIIGGLVGGAWYRTKIEDCGSDAYLVQTGQNKWHSGGILGRGENTSEGSNQYIRGCYYSGIIEGGYYLGGIVAQQPDGIIENCYNTGTIGGDGPNDRINGGICAIAGENVIRNCYNAGNLTEEGKYVHKSAIGSCNKGSLKYRNYYLLNCGAQYPNYKYESWGIEDDGVSVGVTEDELRNLAPSLGEYFTEDVRNINNGYPILKWQLNN